MSSISCASKADRRRGCNGPTFIKENPIMGKQTNSKPPKEASGKGGKKGGY
jgi:hypothetical protein